MTANISAPLTALALRQPDAPALIVPTGTDRPGPFRETRLSFRQLDDEVNRLAAGLARLGIQPGMRAALMVPPGVEFYALTFALFRLGAIVVLIDPGMGVFNLGSCLTEAAPEAFIGITRAHLGRLFLGWARKTIQFCVTIGPRLGWGGWSLSYLRQQGHSAPPLPTTSNPDDTAAILYTSGSTGPAKGAVYSHGNFAAQVDLMRTVFGIRPGEIDLPTFPLFGLFGPALGMTAVIPEMDFTQPAHVSPSRLIHAIQHYQVTNLFGSPALLRRLAFSEEARNLVLPTLRRVLSAGAPVPASVLRQTEHLLAPGVPIHTPYGATEALPVATITAREVLDDTAPLTSEGKGVCVGLPVPGMQVRILRLSDEPIAYWDDNLVLPPNTIGEIAVCGPVVTRSYFNLPRATALHKVYAPDGVWHRMGDVGYLDSRGRIWFCGRKSQRVQSPGKDHFTIPCEGVFNAHPAVMRSALVGVPGSLGLEPVLCIELDPNARHIDQRKLLDQLLELADRHDHTRDIRHILIHPGFPVDIRHNAKIFREQLAPWAARQLGRRPA